MNSLCSETLREQLRRNLRALRKSAGLSQREIAEMLHINRSTYTYYEMGKTTPGLETLCLLAKLYRVPLEAFADPASLPGPSPKEGRELPDTGGEMPASHTGGTA